MISKKTINEITETDDRLIKMTTEAVRAERKK
jgi:hypothetical protein